MRSLPFLTIGTSALLVIGVAACGGASSSTSTSPSGSSSGGSAAEGVTLSGAGSTFAAPIWQQVAGELKAKSSITENYQSVGSGAGVSQFTAGTTDFAGSDPALKDEEMKALKSAPIQVPIALGAITVSYNLPGVKSGLKLDGKTIADVYLGKVKSWDDPAISAQNPGVKLPATAITVVHRSDSSGTTKGFADFLSRYSAQWKSQVGVDKDLKWPTGTGGKGNEGVAAAVKQTEGAVGYVEQAYALQNKFTFADVKNKSGKYIAPTLESTSASGDGIAIPSDLRVNVIDSPNPKAYPVSSQTFAITYQDPCAAGMTKQKAAGLKAMIGYLLGDGQQTVQKLAYAPIPAALKQKATTAVGAMRCNGSPLPGT